MCYYVNTRISRLIKKIRAQNPTLEIIGKNNKLFIYKWEGHEYFQVSGFDHPFMTCIIFDGEWKMDSFRWGLVPSYTRTVEDAAKIQNVTLNARGETLFEKSSFRNAVMERRCLVPVAGFYEHKHKSKKAFPHHIVRKDGDVMILAGVWEEGINPDTGQNEKSFSIVSTEANELMHEIHNHPTHSDGPRMPVILDAEGQDTWLDPKSTREQLESLIHPSGEILEAYTVRPLRGAKSAGDEEKAIEKYHYHELDEPLTLF